MGNRFKRSVRMAIVAGVAAFLMFGSVIAASRYNDMSLKKPALSDQRISDNEDNGIETAQQGVE